jgi:uncharacterized protein YcfJ
MKIPLKMVMAVAALASTSLSFSQVTFYENEHFRGRTFAATKSVNDFRRNGFSDRSSSVIVQNGRWEVCDDIRFAGRCVVLRPGNYDSLAGMGMENRISSARPVRARRDEYPTPDPVPAAAYEYRRRPNEQIFDARVTSVRAVVGPPNERCWMEPGPVASDNRKLGGTIAGALIGGILGHQVGGGAGKDLATAGGAVAGGMIGNNLGKNNGSAPDSQVRRCETTASTTPEYWDVTYQFRGVEHRLQMTQHPGSTIEVNARGEPRQ